MARRVGFPVLLVLCLSALAGCSALPVPGIPTPAPVTQPFVPPAPTPVAVFQHALDAWHAAGIDSYTWQLRFACECSFADPLEVTVVDGRVTHVRRPAGDVGLADVQALPLTVDALLARAIDVTKGGGAVDGTWSRDDGVPSNLHIDPDRNAIDDELDVQVISFEAASPSPR